MSITNIPYIAKWLTNGGPKNTNEQQVDYKKLIGLAVSIGPRAVYGYLYNAGYVTYNWAKGTETDSMSRGIMIDKLTELADNSGDPLKFALSVFSLPAIRNIDFTEDKGAVNRTEDFIRENP